MTSEIQMQHCLAPRLYSYPMVKAAVDQLSAGYEYGKTYRGIGALLGLAESSIVTAAGAVQPLVHKVDPQIISAEKLACGYLDTVDEKYPSVKSEPKEVLEAAQAYYNDTRLKTGVDFTLSTANKVYTMPQVGRAYYEQKKEAALAKVHNTVDATVITMTKQIHSVLDAAEAALDSIAAGSSGEKHSKDSSEQAIRERIAGLTLRAASEAGTRLSHRLDLVKDLTSRTMQNLASASIILDYIKARQEWAKETMLSVKDETVNVVVATRQRVTDFASKLRTMDDLQNEVHKTALAQLDRLQQAFHAFLDYINEKVIPSSPDNGHEGGAKGGASPRVKDEAESPKSSISVETDDSDSLEESFD